MFRAFHSVFPEIGVTETRTVRPFDGDRFLDTYFFLELYCDEPGCDCRRVVVHVVSEGAREAGRSGHVASLSFGWEPEQFYRDWARYPLDADDIAELKGPGLQRLAPQTELAEEMLGHFRTLLADRSYVERIKRHYSMFRAKIEAEPYADDEPVAMNRAQRRAARRRKPGSSGRSLGR